MRGIRGAITVEADEPELILSATRELLSEILRANEITDFDEVVSAIFTTTCDLKSTFPAEAARRMGMGQVPLLCAQEIPVLGSMPRCIRVLIHANIDRKPADVRHVYLRNAQNLRPDMQMPNSIDGSRSESASGELFRGTDAIRRILRKSGDLR